jgi:hypothetical protein
MCLLRKPRLCIILGLSLAQLMLAGCGSRKGEITGEVFISTKTGRKIPLGSITVRAISARETRAFVERKKTEARREKERLGALITQAKQSIKRAEAEYSKAKAQERSAVLKYVESESSEHNRAYKLAKARAQSLLALMNARKSELSAVLRSYSYYSSSAFYYAGLPAALDSAQTDSGGAFSLALDRREEYALAAKASPKVEGAAEEYYWLVWASLGGKKSGRIILSNDNLMTSGSGASAVPAESARLK